MKTITGRVSSMGIKTHHLAQLSVLRSELSLYTVIYCAALLIQYCLTAAFGMSTGARQLSWNTAASVLPV